MVQNMVQMASYLTVHNMVHVALLTVHNVVQVRGIRLRLKRLHACLFQPINN